MTETTPALDRNARNWTLASAALALLPLLLQLPPLLAGVIAAAALVTAVLSWRKVLPMPVRLLLVLVMLGAIAWQMGMVRPGRDTGCALLAAMLAIKSSELRSRRDARSLLGFALFSPFAAFLLDQGPLTTVLAALAGISALLALQRLAGDEGHAAEGRCRARRRGAGGPRRPFSPVTLAPSRSAYVISVRREWDCRSSMPWGGRQLPSWHRPARAT